MDLEDKTLWKEEQEQATTGVWEALMWTAMTSTSTWWKIVVGFKRHVAILKIGNAVKFATKYHSQLIMMM